MAESSAADAVPPFDPAAFDIDASFYDQNLLPAGALLPFDDGIDLDLNVEFDLDDFDFDAAFLHSPTDDDHSSPPPEAPASSSVFSSTSSPAVSTNRTSPDSPHTSADNSAASAVADPDIKPEEDRVAQQGIKRKKGYTDPIASSNNSNPSLNPSKLRPAEDVNSPMFITGGSDEDEKRKARLMRNRESAHLSRQRKKHYVEELEDKVKVMHLTITELNSKISYFMAENASLRQQLGGGGGPPAVAAAVVYPPPPMHFPWVPGYTFRHPHGASVPLVPIPRLKPQHPAPAPKNRKSESKKGQSKTKKVASVSLLGLFLIMLVVGAVFPGLNYQYGGGLDTVTGRPGVVRDGMFGHSEGRVLTVSGRVGGLNSTNEMGLHSGSRVKDKPASDVPVVTQNTSESIPALLYVPRNGKHVKINGNLIIHSVLASEKATKEKALRDNAKQPSGKEAGLAVAGNVGSSLAISQAGKEVGRHPNSYRSSNEHQKDAYGDTLKSTPVDGPLQQWFREGLAGPILNSGMCTEVFQFEVSPDANPGGIVPVTPIVNATAEIPRKSASQEKMRNRRILYGQPLPIAGSVLNDTERVGRSYSHNNSVHGNTPVPSMVVSVLADPREAGDGDGDGMMSPKTFSRIFVVVLLDSVKYVTYSCALPFKSSSPHLVD